MFRKNINLGKINVDEFLRLVDKQEIRRPDELRCDSKYSMFAKIYSPRYENFHSLLNELIEDRYNIRNIRVPSFHSIGDARRKFRDFKRSNALDYIMELSEAAEKDGSMITEFFSPYDTILKDTYFEDDGINRKPKDVLRFSRRQRGICCVYGYIRKESLDNYSINSHFPNREWNGLYAVTTEPLSKQKLESTLTRK